MRLEAEGRGFDSRLSHWNFSLTHSFRLHYGPGIDSASKRNKGSMRLVHRADNFTTFMYSTNFWDPQAPAVVRPVVGLPLYKLWPSTVLRQR